MKTPTTITTALLATLLVALSGCGRHNNTDAPAAAPTLPTVRVRVAEARVLEQTRRVELPGTVRAVDTAQPAPKIMGVIETLPVTLGQLVKRGDLLAKISAGEINAKLAQAQTALAQATRDLDRERALLAKEATTAETVRNLEDRQRIAQSQVDEAQTMLGYATITAPFDAVVVGKFASEGDLAAPGRPLLALENPLRLRVETGVPESLPRLPIGATVPVQIGATEIAARIAELSPTADATARTFLIKIDLPATAVAGGAQSGQFAKVAWPAEKTATLVVPQTAVTLFGQMERVFVAGADNRATLRIVKTGAKQNATIEILSGLAPGERVIIETAQPLRDGQPLEVQP